MKKKSLLFFYVCFPLLSYSQIGINTYDPQQAIHISGKVTDFATAPAVGSTLVKIIEPTVRIEGLNSTNNPAHDTNNINSLQRVHISHEGELVLKQSKSFNVLVNEKSAFPRVYSDGVSTAANTANPISLGEQSVVKVKSYDFEVTEESMVYIKYGINTRIYRSSDKRENLFTTTQYYAESFVTFSNASDPQFYANTSFPDISLAKTRFAEDSYQIINSFNTYINPNIYLSSNRSFLLQPGLYTVDLFVSNSGRTSFSIGTDVPDENQFDFFKIIAIPTKR